MQRSVLYKLLSIAFIALLLLLPIALIEDKIHERSLYKETAREQVRQSWTRGQSLVTPVIVQPYMVERETQVGEDDKGKPIYKLTSEERLHLLLPNTLAIRGEIKTETRYQGIYGIPVYRSQISMNGTLDAEQIQSAFNEIKRQKGFINYGAPYLSFSVSDVRGLSETPALTWNGQATQLEPNTLLHNLSNGAHAALPPLTAENLSFNLNIGLRGMETIRLVPVAIDASTTVYADWPHPQFTGAFLPDSRDIGFKEFTAVWQVNHFSTGVKQKLYTCIRYNCDELFDVGFGVNLLNSVDVYLKTERSVKYAILFIGLTFVAFFVLETIKKLRIHPIQYSLVGFSIAVFFLLLLSLSEHIPFGFAYLSACVGCVLLTAYYLHFVVKRWQITLVFSAVYFVLYGLLYCILQAEDYALMLGSLLIFVFLSITMICTRSIDWYNPSALDNIKADDAGLKMS